MADIRLIVGLGNPGPEYENTRHNAGEWFLNQLADTFNAPLKPETKFFGKTARITVAGKDVRLLYPTTFMETFKFDDVNDAVERLREGKAHYRVVLTK